MIINMSELLFSDNFSKLLSDENWGKIKSIHPDIIVNTLNKLVEPPRGKEAEKSIYSWLVSNFPKAGGFEIINNSSTIKSCDLLLKYKDITILIEVKDYKTNIPKKEIEKFNRDINVNNPTMALFISMNTPITSIGNDIVFKKNEWKDTLCGFIPSLNNMSYVILRQIILFMIEHSQFMEKKDTKDISTFCELINGKLKQLNMVIENLRDLNMDFTKKIQQICDKILTTQIGIRNIIDDIQ